METILSLISTLSILFFQFPTFQVESWESYTYIVKKKKNPNSTLTARKSLKSEAQENIKSFFFNKVYNFKEIRNQTQTACHHVQVSNIILSKKATAKYSDQKIKQKKYCTTKLKKIHGWKLLCLLFPSFSNLFLPFHAIQIEPWESYKHWEKKKNSNFDTNSKTNSKIGSSREIKSYFWRS